VPGKNGDKLKRRKSKRRHQNDDNPERRQGKGNITKSATEKYGQNGDKNKGQSNASIKLLIINIPQTNTALQLGRLLDGSQQTSNKL